MKVRTAFLCVCMAFILACGSDDSGDSDNNGSPPLISNFEGTPDSAQAGSGDVTVTGTFDFVDADGDVALLRISWRICGEGDWQIVDMPIADVYGTTAGSIGYEIIVGTDCPPGVYPARVSVFDAAGNQSNVLTASLTLTP